MTIPRPAQAGFSLTELMIAMLVTLLVSGAVFGLLTAGQGAFRREPELTDRQQNIRVAMDLIQRDIATAGVGLGDFDQVFTRGDSVTEGPPLLDGLPLGIINTPSGAGVRPDGLEILGSDGECPDVAIDPAAGSDGNLTITKTSVPIPACYPATGNGIVALTWTGTPNIVRWGLAHNMLPGGTTFDFTGPQPLKSKIGPGGAPQGPLNATPGVPARVSRAQIVRYAIAMDAPPLGLQPMPCLWRSTTGGMDPATAAVLPPASNAAWQLVARGIEDLQIQYRPPNGAFASSPLIAGPGVWGNLVQEVQVTILARAQGQNLQGMRTDGGMPAAVRGSLTTVTSPRTVLLALRGAPAPFTWQ